MSKKYSPIISTNTKETFFKYLENINLHEIDYFAIGIQSQVTKTSMSLMSRPDWQKHFSYNEYAEFDPLRKVTLNTQRKIIIFNEIDYSDNFGKEIMHKRKIFGICDGFVLMERLGNYNYMITLGTGFLEFEAFDFIKKNYDGLIKLKKDLIKIIDTDAKKFLKKEAIKNRLNYLSIDAK